MGQRWMVIGSAVCVTGITARMVAGAGTGFPKAILVIPSVAGFTEGTPIRSFRIFVKAFVDPFCLGKEDVANQGCFECSWVFFGSNLNVGVSNDALEEGSSWDAVLQIAYRIEPCVGSQVVQETSDVKGFEVVVGQQVVKVSE